MTPADMAAIHAAAFQTQRPWSQDEFAGLLLSDLVFWVSPAPSCFALGRAIADEAELLTIATHPDHQRKGQARACMAAFLQQCRDRAVRRIFLEVDERNPSAIALYTSTGFHQTGRRTGYYTHADTSRSDAVLMVCELS